MQRLATTLMLALIALALPTTHASAALWQLTFSGTISNVDPGFDPPFTVGDTFTGVLIFDDTAPDSDVDPAVGTYDAQSLSVGVSSPASSDYYNRSSLPNTATLSVINNLGGVGDGMDIAATLEAEAEGSGLPEGSAFLQLIDSSGTAFDSDSLPTSLNLGDFDSAMFDIVFAGEGEGNGGLGLNASSAILDPGGESGISGDLTSLSLVLVPEPSSLALLGLGGLIANRRRKGQA